MQRKLNEYTLNVTEEWGLSGKSPSYAQHSYSLVHRVLKSEGASAFHPQTQTY